LSTSLADGAFAPSIAVVIDFLLRWLPVPECLSGFGIGMRGDA
jgi:hypothetical protein